MPILSAIYKHKGAQTEMTPQQIEVHQYETKYKGNLFCSTEGCSARIVYVHKAPYASYFRTWKYENHIENCLHKFDRERGKVGSSVGQIFNVEASPAKKGKALEEAFRLAQQDESTREFSRSNKKNKSPTVSSRAVRAHAQLVLFEGIDEVTVSKQGIRLPRILKRDAKALKDSDVGKVRLVYGTIQNIVHESRRAQILIDGGEKSVQVRFEEAFFAINPTFEGLFHHAHRLLTEIKDVLFTGIGEVQVRATGVYEVFIYQGQDFKLQNSTLQSLAAYYSSGLAE